MPYHMSVTKNEKTKVSLQESNKEIPVTWSFFDSDIFSLQTIGKGRRSVMRSVRNDETTKASSGAMGLPHSAAVCCSVPQWAST